MALEVSSLLPAGTYYDTDDQFNDHAGQQTSDGIQYILEDHSHLKELFSKYKEARDLPAKVALADRMVKHISLHASAEERYLYPLVKRLPGGQALYDGALVDDQVVKDLLHYMESHGHSVINPHDNEWRVFDATVHKLTNYVLEHIDLEEKIFLAGLSNILTPEEKAQLRTNMISGKKSAPTHPHPAGPNTGAAARLTHPAVGVADRAYDAVRGTIQQMVK